MERKVVFLLFTEFISPFSAVKCRVWCSMRERSSGRGEGRGTPLSEEPRASNFLPINTRLVIIFLPRIEFQIRRNLILVDSRLLIELPFLKSSCLLNGVVGFSASSSGSHSVHKPGWLWSQKWDDWQKSPTSQKEEISTAASEVEHTTCHGCFCEGVTKL